MPIRYVCLSDLHLGEEDSLLTNLKGEHGEGDAASPSPVLTALADCLRALLEKHGSVAPRPTLILNGDVLELALSTTDQAIRVFTQFLSLVMPGRGELFGEIIYIPGNHDHHLWETARETQYLNYMRKLPLDADFEPPWHTTKVLMDMAGKDRLPHEFLTGIAQRLPNLHDRQMEILTAYPNFGVTRTTGKGRRCVVFHHGHFMESIYHLMSTLVSLVFPTQRGPETVYELEGENSAWIDFFWSALGGCQRVGQDIETIYEASGDSTSLQRLTDTLAKSIALAYDVPLLEPNWTEEQVLKLLFRKKLVEKVAGRQERQKRLADETVVPLSRESQQAFSWYLKGPLRSQMQVENGGMPELAGFVFGHTHKPFEAVMEAGGARRPVPTFNTGGWVVDTVQPDRHHGAAVTVIDDELNCVNIRVYDEYGHAASIKEPDDTGVHAPFYDQIAETVNAGTAWRAIGAAAADAIAVREERLKARRLRCNQP